MQYVYLTNCVRKFTELYDVRNIQFIFIQTFNIGRKEAQELSV